MTAPTIYGFAQQKEGKIMRKNLGGSVLREGMTAGNRPGRRYWAQALKKLVKGCVCCASEGTEVQH